MIKKRKELNFELPKEKGGVWREGGYAQRKRGEQHSENILWPETRF